MRVFGRSRPQLYLSVANILFELYSAEECWSRMVQSLAIDDQILGAEAVLCGLQIGKRSVQSLWLLWFREGRGIIVHIS